MLWAVPSTGPYRYSEGDLGNHVFHSRRLAWTVETALLFGIPSITHCKGAQATRGYEWLVLTPFPFTRRRWPTTVRACKAGALIADPLPWWEKHVAGIGIPVLAIRSDHIRALASLPELHKDPFDRIPVAQAIADGLTLASKDTLLARYGVPVVW